MHIKTYLKINYEKNILRRNNKISLSSFIQQNNKTYNKTLHYIYMCVCVSEKECKSQNNFLMRCAASWHMGCVPSEDGV